MKGLSPQALLVFCVSILCCSTVDWPDTHTGSNFAAIFDYAMSEEDITVAAKDYGFVWGAGESKSSKSSENRPGDRIVRAWRKGNPGIVVSRYLPFSRDPDAERPNQWWYDSHPDWILYRCDKVTPAWQYNDPVRHEKMPLNIANHDVIDWQFMTYIKLAENDGYDAIAFDNFLIDNWWGACGTWENGKWIQLYSGERLDPVFTQHVLGWLKSIRSLTRLKIILNFSTDSLEASDRSLDFVLNHVDGLLDETGFFRLGEGNYAEKNSSKIDRMKLIQSHGVAVVMIDQIREFTPDNIQFSVDTYQRGNEGRAYLSITGVQTYGGGSLPIISKEDLPTP